MMNLIAEQVKQRVDIQEIIEAAGIELKPSGGERLKGLCPFHSEDTPSFFVYRDRRRFHCFGCGRDGDVIDFIQQQRDLSFPEALKTLGSEDWRSSPEEHKRIRSEKRQREVLKWRERELARTIGAAIRIAEQSLLNITPETLDDFALIIQNFEALKYQHSIFIEGSQEDRAALIDDLRYMKPFPRRTLFRKNFEYGKWFRSLSTKEKNGTPDDEIRTATIEISFN